MDGVVEYVYGLTVNHIANPPPKIVVNCKNDVSAAEDIENGRKYCICSTVDGRSNVD